MDATKTKIQNFRSLLTLVKNLDNYSSSFRFWTIYTNIKLVILDLNRPMIDSQDHFYQFEIKEFSKNVWL